MSRRFDRRRRSRAGFTLIELMAVLVILSILIAVLVSQLGAAEDVARIKIAKTQLAHLETAIASYETERGDYPPSSSLPEWGPPPNKINVGAECLVIALYSKGFAAGGASLDDRLGNSDADQSKTKLTDFGTRELFEVRDPWDNPVAYFHRADYGKAQLYATVDPETGVELESEARAFTNAKLGRYYAHDKFQLVSAGPDGRFGNEDDVTSFERAQP